MQAVRECNLSNIDLLEALQMPNWLPKDTHEEYGGIYLANCHIRSKSMTKQLTGPQKRSVVRHGKLDFSIHFRHLLS